MHIWPALMTSRLAHDHQTVTKIEFSEILHAGVPFYPYPGVDISLVCGIVLPPLALFMSAKG
jgi:hypothetical protein